MDKWTDILVELIFFVIVAILFMIILSIFFRIILKKFKVQEKNLKWYGLLLNMDNKSLISVSCLSLNYIFLIWLLVTFKQINIAYIAFTFILVLVGDLTMMNFPRIFLNLLNNVIACVAIYIVYLLKDYLANEYMSIPVLIVLILVLIFVFMYFTYNLFKSLNVIAKKHEYIKNKEFKV